MKTSLMAIVSAVAMGAASIIPAAAYDYGARYTGFAPYETQFGAPLGVHDQPFYEGCYGSSASEGNANQQTRPVKQYGQTSGGYNC